MPVSYDHRPLWERIVSCRSCKARIVWFRTENGKAMPVDSETVKVGDTRYEQGKHMPHFATCPQGKAWSKKKKKQ